ncbi:MAG: hypothetical protein H6550_12675 [Chitinophagales bacterium]|nr:hypothetical protein [Chitinophagales bacterium]
MYIRAFILSALAITLGLASCQKFKDIFNITITVPYDDAVAITGIPGDPHVPSTGLKESLGLIKIPTNSAEILADNQSALDLVTSVSLSQMGVDLLLPTYQDVSMADSIWLYVSANGVPEQLIAYNYNVPDTGKRLDLTPNPSVELMDVFVSDTMTFRIEGFFVKDVAYNSKIKFDMKFKVKASLIGN